MSHKSVLSMQHSMIWEIAGPLFILAGLAIRYKIAQRKFNRRSINGLELFPSYGKGILTRLIEGIAGILAKLMILIGILLILANSL